MFGLFRISIYYVLSLVLGIFGDKEKIKCRVFVYEELIVSNRVIRNIDMLK